MKSMILQALYFKRLQDVYKTPSKKDFFLAGCLLCLQFCRQEKRSIFTLFLPLVIDRRLQLLIDHNGFELAGLHGQTFFDCSRLPSGIYPELCDGALD